MTLNVNGILSDSLVVISVTVFVLAAVFIMLKKRKNGCDKESCSGCPYSKDCNKKK
ncbi:MAG: FeoB-associated Cys-rich membrane protein [Treponema sp.]|nr:FeoB-associated Cys-rich membrane protein [Candidatus Treponema merdequi]